MYKDPTYNWEGIPVEQQFELIKIEYLRIIARTLVSFASNKGALYDSRDERGQELFRIGCKRDDLVDRLMEEAKDGKNPS